jgi:hypothetical protein
MRTPSYAFALAGAIVALLPAQAGSQGKAPPRRSAPPAKAAPAKAAAQAPPAEEKAPDVQVEQEGKKKVYRIKTEFVIEGRIQKPNAFYVLQRSNINYEWTDLKKDFVPAILESVREHPF